MPLEGLKADDGKINYNGMELEEFSSNKPIFFEPPKKCVVWFGPGDEPIETLVYECDPRIAAPFRTLSNTMWPHCALLPDPPKPRRATNRELARWLAQGNGQIQYDDKTKNFGKSPDGERHKALKSTTTFEYFGADDFYVVADIQVRKWLDIEWHEPTTDYLFGGGVTMPKDDYPLHHTDAEPQYVQVLKEEYEALKKRVRELDQVKVLPGGNLIMCPAYAAYYIEEVVKDFTTWRDIDDNLLRFHHNRFVLVKTAGCDIPEVAVFYPLTKTFKNRNGKIVPNVKQWRPIY